MTGYFMISLIGKALPGDHTALWYFTLIAGITFILVPHFSVINYQSGEKIVCKWFLLKKQN
jgi:hypothetical protein